MLNNSIFSTLCVALVLTVSCKAKQGNLQERAIVAETAEADTLDDADVLNATTELYSQNTLIIFYDAKQGKDALKKAIKDYGAEIMYDYNSINAMAIRLPEGKNVHEAKKLFKKVEGVTAVNLDRINQLMDGNPTGKRPSQGKRLMPR